MKINLSPPLIYSSICYLLASIMFVGSLYTSSLSNSLLLQWPVNLQSFSPIDLALIIDPYSLSFSSIVLFISGNVLLFTKTYMSTDPYIKRFTHLILAFISSMLLLIMIPNMLTMLIGWDGLGVVSFLLVIYYANAKSLSAGMLTALTNRLGDALIIISIAILISYHLHMPLLWTSNPLIVSILAVAAFTKSAQIPFSSWLPAAMAAPTPISALVHSSTLVTAGVYIIFRLSSSFNHSPTFLNILMAGGVLTMFMAGLVACMETDMKKVIALSTLSQLGLMIFTFGANLPLLAFFHMATHALFKALLFICMGHIIHLNSHNQDLRTAKSLDHNLINSCFLTANLALCGTPFLAAFYSKDLILEMTSFTPLNSFTFSLAILSTSLTASYTARLLSKALWKPSTLMSSSEDTAFSPLPLILLTLTTITGGAMLNWAIIPMTPTPILSPMTKMWPLLVSIIGFIMGLLLTPYHSPTINYTLSTMLLLQPLSTQLPLSTNQYLAHSVSTLDQGWNETLGGKGFSILSLHLSPSLSTFQPLATLPQILLSFSMALPFIL